MIPEDEGFFHLNQMLSICTVGFSDQIKDLELDHGLLMKLLFVPDDLKGHFFLHLMVKSLKHLPKRPHADLFNDLEPVHNVFVHSVPVVPLFIVKTIIKRALFLKVLIR